MILVLGSSADRVYPRLMAVLHESGHPFVVVDEDRPEAYCVQSSREDGRAVFRMEGGECNGTRPVGAIFCRHAVARSLDANHMAYLGLLQTALNRMLLSAIPPIVNPPANSYSNYSKPYQVGLLAAAGFDVPRSLVTNDPARARRFYQACGGQVIVKGVSNVPTLARVWDPEYEARLDLLPNSPTLFQEYVAGADYRVHVVGSQAFVTRLISQDEDYRRSALADDEIDAQAARLPAPVVERCIAITRQLGLVVGGIDFKEDAGGRLVALELNPYPQFTFYEHRSRQPITAAVVTYLIQNQTGQTNVFA